MYDNLRFLIFFLLTTNNAIDFFHPSFLVIEKISVLFYHSFHTRYEKTNFYNLAIFYLLTKSTNPIQKYPHIIELYDCIL